MPAEAQANLFDLIFGMIIVLSLLHGFYRRFSGALATLAGFAFALLLGSAVVAMIKNLMSSWGVSNTVADVGAMLLFLVIIIVVVTLSHKFLRTLFKFTISETADMVLGGVAGAIRGLIIAAAIAVTALLIPNEQLNTYVSSSLSGRFVDNALPFVLEKIEEHGASDEDSEEEFETE